MVGLWLVSAVGFTRLVSDFNLALHSSVFNSWKNILAVLPFPEYSGYRKRNLFSLQFSRNFAEMLFLLINFAASLL